MNNAIECTSGLCEHPEHTVNALVWILPAIAAAFLINKIYKNFKASKK